ncbi:MAG: hypothetical protein PQJ59_06985 [Spirochaetales bacterium]|nr:hypothetical protein [Spirochaetales bacterium]
MCPDKSLLSAWYDGEVEEPWKEKIDKHINECVRCRAVVEEFKKASLFLQDEPPALTPYRKKELHRRVMQQHRRKKMLTPRHYLSWSTAVAALAIVLSLILRPFVSSGATGDAFLARSGKADLSAMEELVPINLPPDQSLFYYGDSELQKSVSFEEAVQ